ncbi:MAG: tetraacyldisaccharide 4'-kinase [Holophagales bacterium]|nr:tetraacyldisaccharide 4'-kinase [Holophagales bacterium]
MRSLLLPLSHLYGSGVRLRLALYRRGLLTVTASRPVISVGNRRGGRNRKDPFVRWLAGELLRRGRHPSILTRGYMAARATAPSSLGRARNGRDGGRVGDEPALHRPRAALRPDRRRRRAVAAARAETLEAPSTSTSSTTAFPTSLSPASRHRPSRRHGSRRGGPSAGRPPAGALTPRPARTSSSSRRRSRPTRRPPRAGRRCPRRPRSSPGPSSSASATARRASIRGTFRQDHRGRRRHRPPRLVSRHARAAGVDRRSSSRFRDQRPMDRPRPAGSSGRSRRRVRPPS